MVTNPTKNPKSVNAYIFNSKYQGFMNIQCSRKHNKADYVIQVSDTLQTPNVHGRLGHMS